MTHVADAFDVMETSYWPPSAPGFGPAADQITCAIERDIFRGRLRPGEKLSEDAAVDRLCGGVHCRF